MNELRHRRELDSGVEGGAEAGVEGELKAGV